MNILKHVNEAQVAGLDLSWHKLELDQKLLAAIKDEYNFNQMSTVQAASIPLMLKNKDVIVEAKTGSGKTLAFLIPIIELLIRQDAVKPIETQDLLAIILSPTRELTTQIHQELRKLTKRPLLSGGRRLVTHLLVGGSSGVSGDIQKFDKHGGNIIVATPGRLQTILELKDNKLNTSVRRKLAHLVFDEADQLLSVGFEGNLSSILAYLPKQRRTYLFSATQTSEVEILAKAGIRNPIRVNVNQLVECRRASGPADVNCDKGAGGDGGSGVYYNDSDGTRRLLTMPDRLTNYFHICDSYSHKVSTLCELIRHDEFKCKKIVVFLSTCAQIEYFARLIEEELQDKRIIVMKLHRRLKNKRRAIFEKFKANKRCLLLATDILSRGIDVPDISCVVHLDLPTSPECYVHRSGRSGHQLELAGTSLLLIEKHEADYVEMCRRRQIEMDLKPLKHLHASIQETRQRLLGKMNTLATGDPDFETAGVQAFVSYVRYYSSKLCLRQLLFPKLNLERLISCFGLLKVPKMPELKNLARTRKLASKDGRRKQIARIAASVAAKKKTKNNSHRKKVQ